MIQGRDEDEGCCCGGHEHDASEDCGCGSHEGGCCGDHEGHGDGCGGHGHEGGHSHEGGCCGHHGGGCCGGGCGHNASDDQIRMFIVGPIETDCYAYVSEGECLVVDPGNSGAAIARHLEDVRVTTIVATHGHGDHVGGVKALRDATGARFLMHEADVELAGRAGEASELGRSYDDDAPEPDQTIADGDVIELGTASFRVIGAPGHTPGGIVLLGQGTADGVAFVVDTLFKGSCGRTDLAGGDHDALMATLARLREEIPARTTLFCGHGDSTTMMEELEGNPWLQPDAVSDGMH